VCGEEASNVIFEHSAKAFPHHHPNHSHHQKCLLRHPNLMASSFFDTQYVYAFRHYGAILSYSIYQAHLVPGVIIELSMHLNGQPMSMGVVTKEGTWVFRFRIWHEYVFEQFQDAEDENLAV
jgi:hypothetical protein